MKILIPSRARPGAQITARTLTDAGVDFTIVRTIGDDTVYPSEYDQVWVEADGIAEKRNEILRLFPGKMMVIDDDITFFSVDEVGKTWPTTNADIREIVRLTDHHLDTYAHTGVARRYMIQNQPRPHVLNRKVMGVRGYNTDLFPDPWPKFRMRACSDIDFNMQLIAKGRSVLLLTAFCQQDGPYMAPGGCSVWRTNETIAQGMRELEALWPGYVRLREGDDLPGGVLATIHIAKLAKDHGLPTR